MSWKQMLVAATLVLSSIGFTPGVRAQTTNKGFSDFVSGAGTEARCSRKYRHWVTS